MTGAPTGAGSAPALPAYTDPRAILVRCALREALGIPDGWSPMQAEAAGAHPERFVLSSLDGRAPITLEFDPRAMPSLCVLRGCLLEPDPGEPKGSYWVEWVWVGYGYLLEEGGSRLAEDTFTSPTMTAILSPETYPDLFDLLATLP